MNKIIIVDDHPVFRSGLKQILNDANDMEVVGEAGNAVELYQLLDKVKWDVVILDISLPGESGLVILKELKYRFKKCNVLCMSYHPESQFGVRVLKAGAVGYITKEAAPEEVVNAIRRIVSGRRYISSSLAEKLADSLGIHPGKPAHDKLSDREFQVMCMIGNGKSNKEIARELFLSAQTVSTYKSRILEKMNMKTTAEITRYVVENNL
jgi:two-component system invasion response regulator UvrY